MLLVSDYGELDHPHPYIVEIRRIDLLELLSERLAELGGEVLAGREVLGLTRDENRIAGVRYREGADEREVRSQCVVGADGAGSRVRAELGVKVRRSGPPDRYVVGIARAPGVELSDIRIYCGPGFGNGVAPIGQDVYFWDRVTAENRDAVEARSLAGWGAVFTRRVPFGDRLVAGISLFDELSVVTARAQQLSGRTAEGAALAGDAAGTVHPHAGQGANLALEDAVALGDLLAGRKAGPVSRAELEPYAGKRHRKARLYAAWSELAARSLDAPTLPWRAVRRLNAYWNGIPPVRRANLKTMAGLRGG